MAHPLTPAQKAYLARLLKTGNSTGHNGMRRRLVSLKMIRLGQPNKYGIRNYELTSLGRLAGKIYGAQK